ncbi:Ran-binding-domain-containing protein [Xylariaceae sp. FL0662B]|nr:Ran-binding-domain-containing protein [Xylariaceae sp. FL0662B]
MDAFLAKLSYHATNYAIRSCLALTSTYVIQQGSRLLKTVDDDPLRVELSQLQRRLARKIQLISPILESIEFRYTRGNSALEAVVRTAHELRQDIDTLGKRLEVAAYKDEAPENTAKSSANAAVRRAEVRGIIADIKQLIIDIDDSIPLINLWVSAIGGIQTQPSPFSPSRLLQASMLVNVGDTQYILDPGHPMQIGPDFTLSLYMLFRAHASSEESDEPYGVEEGQRKPMWQEVIHKARVRLYRVPLDEFSPETGLRAHGSPVTYAYQLQIVEDLDDERVHTLEDGDMQPTAYDGIPLAGVRESIPIHQISKMFYADVGRILNINNEDGASSNPVLLLKRDIQASRPNRIPTDGPQLDQSHLIENIDESIISDNTLSEGDSQDNIDRQLRQESEAVDELPASSVIPAGKSKPVSDSTWNLPKDLDPEWLALEVFEVASEPDRSDSEAPTAYDDDEEEEEEPAYSPNRQAPKHASRPSVDSNLITQLNRMSIASTTTTPSRRSSRGSSSRAPTTTTTTTANNLNEHHCHPQEEDSLAPGQRRLLERSPFGAIKTSLSLLEMLLRLLSLQEFEQTTHLAIPDHVLRFYLDESASTSGLHGREQRDARADAHRKVGFDPYADAPPPVVRGTPR